MLELTKHQEAVLTRLATRQFKKYASYTSTEADGKAKEQIDQLFAQDMQLVEAGLLYNVTSQPKHQDFVKRVKKEDGRDIFVLAPTPLIELMFGRNAWQRWVN
jgi:RecA-family ATPase